ncbi:LrgB family protein [Aurantimonas sp. C2-6-R+9]|uniref:LrgB family protein n=1 Tax=unclassified Aurantimonas TaxID=2638230 RepID=UPI002E17CA15|nr:MULTISPECIES: LrgB family protein [unclassified Aurantimonas]MEC5293217.1 LrgB family protein [Aurantimonas sp. C2-3-R2]MEC5383381.1 LrgB family protein [Aurantimonas sp. C2-6-R+9]MEC5414320.1 LrgB family protein [Aurantimonas sp. C2-4-R8]
MPDRLTDVWVYLAASPLLSLTMTLIAYQAASFVYRKAGSTALLNPVLVTVILVVAVLTLTGTSYQTYFEGAQFIHFLLGPATVALAIPLYRQFDKVRQSAAAIAASLLTGSLTAIMSAVGLGLLLRADPVSLIALAPKSATAPVAMGIAEKLGGLPSLTAVLVIATGILGAALGPVLLDRLGIRDPAARGFALGTASHGIGTARALQESEVAGAFSGLAMGLNALATAIILPLIWALVF